MTIQRYLTNNGLVSRRKLINDLNKYFNSAGSLENSKFTNLLPLWLKMLMIHSVAAGFLPAGAGSEP